MQIAVLREAIQDSDAISKRLREEVMKQRKDEILSLLDKLVELNLILDYLPERDETQWFDSPPPSKDLGIGIGETHAWQTPLHREAVKRVLEGLGRGNT